MKTVTLKILKKNRKYFACERNGYKCKLLIDSNSESLPLGTIELLVEDISVRTSYGTDLIFKLAASADEQKDVGICTLKHRYNADLVAACKDLGGKFDSVEKAWVFSGIVSDKVEDLDYLYNSEQVVIDITAKDDIFSHNDAVCFAGYPIARAFGRDSGAKVCDDVALISGSIDSSGSMKNWGTKVYAGTTFRLQIGKELLKDLDESEWEVVQK